MEPSENPTQWIWPYPRTRNVNQYVEFRRSFELVTPDRAELRISVDVNFVVWLNGQFVGTGQFPDFPERRTFSSFNVDEFIRPGSAPDHGAKWAQNSTTTAILPRDMAVFCGYKLVLSASETLVFQVKSRCDNKHCPQRKQALPL